MFSNPMSDDQDDHKLVTYGMLKIAMISQLKHLKAHLENNMVTNKEMVDSIQSIITGAGNDPQTTNQVQQQAAVRPRAQSEKATSSYTNKIPIPAVLQEEPAVQEENKPNQTSGWFQRRPEFLTIMMKYRFKNASGKPAAGKAFCFRAWDDGYVCIGRHAGGYQCKAQNVIQELQVLNNFIFESTENPDQIARRSETIKKYLNDLMLLDKGWRDRLSDYSYELQQTVFEQKDICFNELKDGSICGHQHANPNHCTGQTLPDSDVFTSLVNDYIKADDDDGKQINRRYFIVYYLLKHLNENRHSTSLTYSFG